MLIVHLTLCWKKFKKCLSKPVLFTVIIIVITCWVVVIGGGTLWIWSMEPSFLHPSDEKMIANFEKNTSAFETLRSMITEDCNKGLKRIGNNFTRPEDYRYLGINEYRINEHKRLLHDLDIEMGWSCDTDVVLLYATTAGLSISGSTKGYEYSKSTPQNYFKKYQGQLLSPLESLDSYKPLNPHSFTIYRHIKDNWYLFYEYED